MLIHILNFVEFLIYVNIIKNNNIDMSNLALDFYGHINNKKLRSTKIPDKKVSTSVFDSIEDNIKAEIIKLLKTRSQGKLRDFVNSVYNGRFGDLKFLKTFISEITNIETYAQLFQVFGKLNMHGISSPLEIDIVLDSRNTEQYKVCLLEPVIDLIKEEILEKGDIYIMYKKFLQILSSEINDNSIGEIYLDFINEMVKVYYDYEDTYKVELTYNPTSINQLIQTYPLMADFFKVFDTNLSDIIICVNPSYVKAFYNHYTRIPIKVWKRIIRLNAYISYLEVLPKPFTKIYFDFFYKVLRGQKKPDDDDNKMFSICNDFCYNSVGKLYVSENLAKFRQIRDESTKLFNIVIASAKKRISKSNWLSQTSRTISLFKLEKMGLKMAYPDKWEDDIQNVHISSENFLENLFNIEFEDYKKKWAKLKKREDNSTWNNNCYAVNAYYYPEMNELCIPLGFLNPPFFSLEQSFIENLAGLGNIIGHEISHGFDEEGRKYDENGNYKPWWTSVDIEIYNQKTQMLIAEFDKQTYYGLPISGELTLGENLADFGAMAMCLDILKSRNCTNGDLRKFFIAYSKSWFYKERKKKREQAVEKDRHAPPQLRVNVILRHFAEFYEAFGIKSSDKGFIPESDRITIWG